MTTSTDLSGASVESDLSVKFKNGDHALSAGCQVGTPNTNLVCAKTPAFTPSAINGNYTLTEFTGTLTNTYNPPANTQLCYDITCVGTQTPATGEIDFNDDTKKSFTITIPAYTGETAPVVYAGTTAVTCTANQEKTTITCTPTKEQMANGTHDIFIGACKLYAKTITVKNNSSDPTPSSGNYANLSKLFVLILGLMLF